MSDMENKMLLKLFCELPFMQVFYLDPFHQERTYMKVDENHALWVDAKRGGTIEFNPHVLTFIKDYSHAK